MHPNAPAIRSVFGRSMAEVNRSQPQSLRLCLRAFSTTQCRPAEEEKKTPKNPPATRRQRSAAAASELGALSKSSKPSQPVDARSFASRPPSGGKLTSNNSIISIRSLPRKPTDGDSPAPFRKFGPRTGGDNSQNFRRPGAGAGGPRGPGGPRPAFSGRGRGGPKKAGSRAGGRGKGRRGRKDGEEGKDKEATQDMLAIPEVKEWLRDVEQGVNIDYTPSLTKDSLVGFGAAVGSTTTTSKVETVLRNMRVLGGGVPFNPDGYFTQPEDAKKLVGERKGTFFSDLEERAWLRSHNVRFRTVNENVKKAILQVTIQGKHEAPRFATPKDVTGVLTSYHTRDPTYKAEDGRKFDAKVAALLPIAKAPGGSAKAAKAAKA